MKIASANLKHLQQPAFARDRRQNSLRWAAFCLGAALCFLAVPLHAAKFSASLDRSTITLGESASLSLTFDGASPNDVPALPAIANLQINYIGPSSQFSFVNGQTSSSVTHNFQVTPRQAGDFTIPALTVTLGGQKMTSLPLKLKVLQPGAPPPEAVNAGTQPAFLKLILPKKEVYLGEVIAAELQFYFRQGVQIAGQPQLTATPADGFTTLGKIAAGQQRQVQIGNAVYNVLPAAMALKAIKTGPLTVGPVTAAVVVQLPSQNRRRNPFFEQFGFDDPFNSGERRQLSIATDTETVQSLPLPVENVPPGFNGAVGSYTMNVTAGPTNVATGDPVTVRVQISGRGSLDALTLPEQSAWKDFKAYPPTVNLELADQLGLQGTKTFEQIVTPQSTDVHELPAFSFSFFDPDARAYQTLAHPAVPLTVRPGGATPAPVIAATRNSSAQEPPPAQDIVHIKPRPGTLAQVGPPLVLRPWFVAAQSAPVLAFLLALGWRKRTESLANNPRLRRQRQVAQVIRSGLEELRRHAADKNSDAFFAALVHLLQEQIGERLDCPASSITEAVVDEKLRPRGLPDGTRATLHELFQAANLARYAPVRSEQELAAIVPRLETALRELRELKA
ncbi:MAG: BatD family protein [Verrucomicrobia bacterium]|nr:BatD family protein [Verrucomicrobiota bacterium]